MLLCTSAVCKALFELHIQTVHETTSYIIDLTYGKLLVKHQLPYKNVHVSKEHQLTTSMTLYNSIIGVIFMYYIGDTCRILVRYCMKNQQTRNN